MNKDEILQIIKYHQKKKFDVVALHTENYEDVAESIELQIKIERETDEITSERDKETDAQ